MFGRGVQIFRDDKVTDFKNNVYNQLADIAQNFEPQTKQVDISSHPSLISIKQAIKELLEIENEINQKKS
jgi:hypothetical protein